jgi:prevent-host-death family protein
VDEVERRDEEIVITRNGQPAAVLVSPDEYDSWKETLAVRSDKALIREIKAGLAEIKSGKARRYSIEKLFR